MAPYSIEELRNIVSPIARAHGVASVSLFGSYAKGLADAGVPTLRVSAGH